jgi:hypothetical protein
MNERRLLEGNKTNTIITIDYNWRQTVVRNWGKNRSVKSANQHKIEKSWQHAAQQRLQGTRETSKETGLINVVNSQNYKGPQTKTMTGWATRIMPQITERLRTRQAVG